MPAALVVRARELTTPSIEHNFPHALLSVQVRRNWLADLSRDGSPQVRRRFLATLTRWLREMDGADLYEQEVTTFTPIGILPTPPYSSRQTFHNSRSLKGG